MSRWPDVALGEVLTKSDDWIQLDPEREYKEVTVRNRGQGAVLRRTVTGADIAGTRRMRVHYRQFIVSRIDARHGSTGVIPSELEAAIVTNDFPAFDCDEHLLLPEYLGWYSKTVRFVDECRHASEGSTNRVRLKEPAFLEITMPLPPVEEQRRVVEKLNRLATQVRSAQSRISGAETRAATLANVWFQRWLAGLRSDAVVATRLGDVVVDTRYGTSQKCSDEAEGVPVLRMGNIRRGRIDPSGLKYLHPAADELRKLTLGAGDILVCRTNSAELVGKCAVFELVGQWAFASYLIRLRLDVSRADPHYVAAFINSSLGRSYMFSNRKQMTGQANINTATLRGVPLPLPALEEQQRFVARLHALEGRLTRIRHISRAVSVEFDALIAAGQSRLLGGAVGAGVSSGEEMAR